MDLEQGCGRSLGSIARSRCFPFKASIRFYRTLEPEGQNTAPALTLAALSIRAVENDGVMLVMPADHLIRDRTALQTVIRAGRSLAERGYLITFGIREAGGGERCGVERRRVFAAMFAAAILLGMGVRP